MAKQPKSVPVFKINKKHAWRSNLLNLVEVGLIILVIAGTFVWLLVASRFSFSGVINTLSRTLKPQATFESTPKYQTAESELRAAIENEKVFEIDSITKTSEGDFSVKAKSNLTVIFSAGKSFSEQVSTLQTLLAKARIESKTLKKVDFRFAKIVVEY